MSDARAQLPSAPALIATGPSDEVVTGEAVALDVRPSNYVLRAAGSLIDGVAYAIILAILVFAAILAADRGFLDGELITGAVMVLVVLCLVVLPMAVETLTRGRSPGKFAVGARIVRDDGGAIGMRHALVRSALGLLELYLTLGGLATVIALFNPRAKRLGDLLAGTYSQHERLSRADPPVYGIPLELQSWSITADVAPMPSGLARRIAQFLQNAAHQTPESRRRVATTLASEAARYVSPLPRVEAEVFLAGVSAMRREREFTAHLAERERLAATAPVLQGLPHGFPER